MTTQDVAKRLVALCRSGNYEQAIKELYSEDIVSVEPEGAPHRIVKGLAAIAEKGVAFQSKIEKVNSNVVTDPIVAENFFTCAMLLNVHMKGVPVPIDMHELCVYTVKDGKVVKEEFFYTPQPQPQMA